MKANELRIGNFVYGIEQGYKETALPVACIHNDNTIRLQVGDETVGCYNSKIIKPIPLTEEWLVKFGFEKRVGEIFMYHTWFYIDKECAGVSGWYFRGIDAFKSKIEYVHQLQNLYFALTGEELTLK